MVVEKSVLSEITKEVVKRERLLVYPRQRCSCLSANLQVECFCALPGDCFCRAVSGKDRSHNKAVVILSKGLRICSADDVTGRSKK